MDKYWWVIPTLFAMLILSVVVGIIHASNQMAETGKTHREWTHKCIDAGGVPVDVLTYVKGIGQGERCVKPVEIVDVK